MNPPGKMITARLEAEDQATLDEIVRRLKTSQTHAIRLALHALRIQAGLIRDDAIRLVERVARIAGDDAVLLFTVHHDPERGYSIAVTVNDRQLDDVSVEIRTALIESAPPEGNVFTVHKPDSVSIVMRDAMTKARYAIGEIDLEDGATTTLSLRELPLRIVGGTPDDRTPEQRLSDTRMSIEILRAAGGLPEDDDE
jgi:hypothetical protein